MEIRIDKTYGKFYRFLFPFSDLNFVSYVLSIYSCDTHSEPGLPVIKHDGHSMTRGKCRKHEPQASVFYISRVFSNDRSVLSQCNTQLRLYDIDFTHAKQ